MAKEVPLYKDKKYVKLLESALEKLKKGFENNEGYTRLSGSTGKEKFIDFPAELYNRAVNALITQPNKAFLNLLENEQGLNPTRFAQKITSREDNLLRNEQPIIGTEGHHIFHQNTVKRIRNLPVAKQLEVMDKFRKLGGTSGVVPENITYLGKMAHRANLLKDKVREVTAHINPFTLKDDTGYWSKDYDFDPNMSVDEIADALHNETYGPQRMIAKNAELRKSTVSAKNWFKKLLGGVDVFDPKLDPRLRKKYKAVLNGLRLSFNDVERAFEEGRTPELPNKGRPIPIIKALKDNPDLISEGKIGTFAKEGKLLKSLKQLGFAKALTVSKSFAQPAADLVDLGIPSRETVEAENFWPAYREELFGKGKALGTTLGLLKVASSLPLVKEGLTKASGVAANPLIGVPLTTASILNQLDESFLEGKGKQALREAKKGEFHTTTATDDTLVGSIKSRRQGTNVVWDEENKKWQEYTIPKI